jgi:hypothetical protein
MFVDVRSGNTPFVNLGRSRPGVVVTHVRHVEERHNLVILVHRVVTVEGKARR